MENGIVTSVGSNRDRYVTSAPATAMDRRRLSTLQLDSDGHLCAKKNTLAKSPNSGHVHRASYYIIPVAISGCFGGVPREISRPSKLGRAESEVRQILLTRAEVISP
jgi:hypothetical protein